MYFGSQFILLYINRITQWDADLFQKFYANAFPKLGEKSLQTLTRVVMGVRGGAHFGCHHKSGSLPDGRRWQSADLCVK